MKSSYAILMRRDAQDAANDSHFPRSSEHADDVFARELASQPIVRPDVAQFLWPGSISIHQEHGDSGGLRSIEHRDDFGSPSRSDDKRRDLFQNLILQDGHLLINVDLALWSEHGDLDIGMCARRGFGPSFQHEPELAVQGFRHDGNAIYPSCPCASASATGKEQTADHKRETDSQAPSIHSLHTSASE